MDVYLLSQVVSIHVTISSNCCAVAQAVASVRSSGPHSSHNVASSVALKLLSRTNVVGGKLAQQGMHLIAPRGGHAHHGYLDEPGLRVTGEAPATTRAASCVNPP